MIRNAQPGRVPAALEQVVPAPGEAAFKPTAPANRFSLCGWVLALHGAKVRPLHLQQHQDYGDERGRPNLELGLEWHRRVQGRLLNLLSASLCRQTCNATALFLAAKLTRWLAPGVKSCVGRSGLAKHWVVPALY